MRHPSAPLLLALFLLVGSARSASAEVAESSYNVVLMGKRTVETAAGDRVQHVRIGTKDVIERFRDTLGGISGRSMRLVVQRPIEDLGLANACEYLWIDGQYFAVGGTSERIEMPASFHGATGTSSRRPGFPDLLFTQEAVGVFRMQDAFEESGDFTFSAVARRTARLHMDRGVPMGYLHTAMVWLVNGGLEDASGPMPVTGRLWLGPEKIVTTPGGPCAP